MTIHDRVARARERLRAAGISSDEAALDARLLAERVLGWTTERYLAESTQTPPDDFDARFDPLVARRASREPYAYIVGHQEFWGLEIEVSPAVLIPRPETELIVEVVAEIIAAGSTALAADIGTGSGCLAVAIARERPNVRLVATDLSTSALDIARRNAETCGVAHRIEFRLTDLLDGVSETFDIVVSNPPYVRDEDQDGIQPEVRFEPAAALYAGGDGLDVIRRLVPHAADRLKPSGTLIFEFGFGQAEAVETIIAATSGLELLAVREDLQGIPRAAVARRTAE